MILTEDGEYFFDSAKTEKYTEEFHLKVFKELFGDTGFNNGNRSYSIKVKNAQFTFTKTLVYITVESDLNKNKINLRFFPIKLSVILTDGQKEQIDIFSKEQFEKIMKNRQIEYPISNSVIFTDQLKNAILTNTMKMEFEIMNIPLKKIFNSEKEKGEVFGKLSSNINLYMKNQFDFENFPEKKFFSKDDFLIKNKDKMVYYSTASCNRVQLILKLRKISNNGEVLFFTGPHGIGKTFTLLSFLTILEPNINYIYINLDILTREKNNMKVLLEEAKNLFQEENEYISAFEYVKNNMIISDLESRDLYFLSSLNSELLSTVIYLIDYIELKIKNPENKYLIVIDQFKYETDTNYDTQLINELRTKIFEKKRFSLIVCSSINYTGIKNILLLKIEKRHKECLFPYEFYNKLCEKPFIQNESEYLNLFGYLPRYCQIQKIINKKYVNVMKKKIKQKFYKFYSKLTNLKNGKLEEKIVDSLRKIKDKRKQILNLFDMKSFIENNPIKYFTIDKENNCYDYLFPLIGTIIDEIIKSKEIKDSLNIVLNNVERGWFFEHSLFDSLKNSNDFLGFYIEDTIEIQSIFKKEIIKDLDKNANTLFTFSISNVKRYDGVLYIPNEKTTILIQASIHKPVKKLAEYTEDNIEDDIKKMNKRLFKPNGISPEKYYLVFVLDYNNYYCSLAYKQEIAQFNYNYCFYEPDKALIHYNNLEKESLKELKHNNSNISMEEEYNEGFLFTKNDGFNLITNNVFIDKPGFYYAEKGVKLLTFLEEIFSEYYEIIDKIRKNKKYLGYRLITYQYKFWNIDAKSESTPIKRIIICLYHEDLYLGEIFENKDDKINYTWTKYPYGGFEEIVVTSSEEKNKIKNQNWYFIFEK